eukprot:g7906.t1
MSSLNKLHAKPKPKYAPCPLHFKVPHGIFIHEATSVAVDSKDNVYCFNRGNMPVLVFNPNGDLIRHWGNPTPYAGTKSYIDPYGNKVARWRGTEFARPHAIEIDHEDNVWLVDDLANVITKCTVFGERKMLLCPEGRVVVEIEEMKEIIGSIHEAPPKQSGRMFNRPTDICVHRVSGDLFVSDGYGNSCVHRLNSRGEHIKSWGKSGTDPGLFNLPHSITIAYANSNVDSNFSCKIDRVLVADRENQRVQIFDLNGQYLQSWHAHRAVAVEIGWINSLPWVYIAEQGTTSAVQRGNGMYELQTWTKNIGHRVGIYHSNNNGILQSKIGSATPGEDPSQFNWLHSIAVDSKGDFYAAEVSFCECGQHQDPHAREMVSLRKWKLVKP